jgi:hypothetical protein
MTTELVKLDESFAEDFWRLRKELFTELGEVAESEDCLPWKKRLSSTFWPILARIWSAGDAGRRAIGSNRFALSF